MELNNKINRLFLLNKQELLRALHCKQQYFRLLLLCCFVVVVIKREIFSLKWTGCWQGMADFPILWKGNGKLAKHKWQQGPEWE